MDRPLVSTTFLDGTAEHAMSLDGQWDVCEIPAARELADFALEGLQWRAASVPGTVGGALRDAGGPEALATERDLDARAFLFRRRFSFAQGDRSSAMLVFDGLATIVDVWLNGALLLRARNMFRRHVTGTNDLLRAENELILHFRPLQSELDRKRPRGRWTVRMAKHRNLRFLRTSLLGRMHGWGGRHPVVGPWQGVRLLHNPRVVLEHLRIVPSLEGSDGSLLVSIAGRASPGRFPSALKVRMEDREYTIPVAREEGRFHADSLLRIPGVEAWWTHDLGAQRRYPVALSLQAGQDTVADLGVERVGFRKLEKPASASGEEFSVRLNGRDVFCRGACWTPSDPVGFRADPEETRRALALVREAGFNMLRVTAPLCYETDDFYEACDEMGIMVWQDFMFARFDYPEGDPDFLDEVRAEAEQLLSRVHYRPSLAVFCGNSEVEQQAAMYGLEPYAGRTPLFAEFLAEIVRRWKPGSLYVSSSPTGGALPFHVNSGVAHYFGVGAYLRPLSDARESGVRFASECLAFSNVPEDAGLADIFGGDAHVVHAARYKEGVPRDAGAGWDFSDVTDHYLEQLFGIDVRGLRQFDPKRYLSLARVVPGELMSRAVGIWRAQGSGCGGALVWLWKDLEPGAGWGLVDSAGRPKAAYWLLRRACLPRALWFTDEGLNGLRLHLHNNPAQRFVGRIRVGLVRADGLRVAGGEQAVDIEGHGAMTMAVDALLGRFADSAWAYRFGEAGHVVALGELCDVDGRVLCAAHHFPGGLSHDVRADIGLQGGMERDGVDGAMRLALTSKELALFVHVAVEGEGSVSDNYFHLAPGETRRLAVSSPRNQKPSVRIAALNSRAVLEIRQ